MDFQVENHGTVWLFTAKSSKAQLFLSELGLADWQCLNETQFAVDHRPAQDLVHRLRDDGFEVTK